MNEAPQISLMQSQHLAALLYRISSVVDIGEGSLNPP